MRGFLSFQERVWGLSLHFKLDNPLNQVKHAACSSISKGDNQLGTKNHNQGFSKTFGTNGSTCCVALIMAHSLHFLHSSSLPCSLSFSSPLPHLITCSPLMHSGMNASAANLHQTCEMTARNKDCSCVFNQGKPFVLGTTCDAVASPLSPPRLPLCCLIRVSSRSPFAERFVSSWDMESKCSIPPVTFSPRLIMPAIRPVAANTGNIDYPTRQQQGHESE